MTVEGGGFASSLDADSEGEEGKFYVWSLAEIEEVLGAEDAQALRRDLRRDGGKGISRATTSSTGSAPIELRDAETEARLAAMRAKLLARRATRVRPGFDDKVLADWNGLMIAALANAARCLRPRRLARGRGARLRFRLYTDDCRTGGCCTPIAPARRRRRRPPTTTPT